MRSPGHSPAAGAGRGGGRHPGRAILTGPAAPGSGARRAHGQRASSPGLLTPGQASHGRRQRALGVGAAPLPRVSGAGGWQVWGANFAGNLRGSGAARARIVETDADARDCPVRPVRGVRGPGDHDPREPDRCCGLGHRGREERQVWETDRLAAGAREGHRRRAQGVCP